MSSPARRRSGDDSTRGDDATATHCDDIVVIGAGPAGLTAAHELAKAGRTCEILEADNVVGGISRTVVVDGNRFDIGGHRFFTKVAAVEDRWRELLPDDLLIRERASRIYYRGKFYDYPLRPLNALANLGPSEALRCVASYGRARIPQLARRGRDPQTLEDYVVANYGRRLYEHFFRAYTTKVWGVDPAALSADWGAQRIKGMSLWSAVWEPMRARLGGRRSRDQQVASLIEEFLYPRLGPGMMWERCAEVVEAAGSKVHFESPVTRISHDNGRAFAVETTDETGAVTRYSADQVISSMPLAQLVAAMEPSPPDDVLDAARQLGFRDYLLVALVVPRVRVDWTDNWVYVHEPNIDAMRIQNFGAWSPDMVRDDCAVLGLEYTTDASDPWWSAPDADLIGRASSELDRLGLVPSGDIESGHVVRMPKAYPIYDEDYQRNVDILRTWLAAYAPNVYPIGRNGMHRYNNQDHSMYTAMLTVDNLLNGTEHDIWSVNVEADYHESGAGPSAHTGRAAPVVPAQAHSADSPT
ncbi:MAG: NAD(P)/FAD-dependent oxidoreductase [Actinomycetota bacterium]